MPELIPVPAPEVADKWHLAEQWVRSAVEEGARVETVESYKDRCLDRSAQLWLITDPEVVGAAVTEIYDTPKGLTCGVPVVASVSFDLIEPLFQFIEGWARSEGCARMEGYGRFGWVRALKPFGWRPQAAVIEKDL